MNVAFLFPGQGAQTVGMGQDLYDGFAAARAVFDQAEAVSGLPLKRVVRRLIFLGRIFYDPLPLK